VNYVLYSIDWRSRAVVVVGCFATRYQAEIANEGAVEKLTPDEAATRTFGIVPCTGGMNATNV
jgi:hypothetical protein